MAKDNLVLVDSSGGARTITLPAPTNGRILIIKDCTGSAATNNITINPNASELIDGASSKVITSNWGEVQLQSNGTNWFTDAPATSSAGMTNPMTTLGDMIYGGSSGTPTRLAIGAEGSILTVSSGLPVWVSATVAGRAVFGTSYPGVSSMEYITINTTGNGTTFGNLSSDDAGCTGVSSSTRGVFCGGYNGAYVTTMDYITIATTSNSSSFGSLLAATRTQAGMSNGTRGVMGGGVNDTTSMEYITIATTGNSTSFGSLTTTFSESAGVNSTTRGILGYNNTMDYITIATAANSTSFGTLSTTASYALEACCSSTIGVFCGGASGTTVMQYVTIASTGNSTTFGNLTTSRYQCAGTSNSVRGVITGGATASSTIDYITIASASNATNFGSLTISRQYFGGLSDSHGGI